MREVVLLPLRRRHAGRCLHGQGIFGSRAMFVGYDDLLSNDGIVQLGLLEVDILFKDNAVWVLYWFDMLFLGFPCWKLCSLCCRKSCGWSYRIRTKHAH